MACCADPARLHSWSLVFLHEFAIHIVTSGRQRFHPRLVHRTRRHLAGADARVSSTGEPKNPGGSGGWTVFYAGRFCLARPVIAGADVPFFNTAEQA